MTDDAAPKGVDLAAVARFLGVPRVRASMIAGGRSNLTYVVEDGESRWVLRRPPLGHVLETAHDMSREFRVISAIAGTPVPVPRPVAFCDDESVIGAPFYVMEHVPGVVIRADDDLDRLPTEIAGGLGDGLVDILAELHSLDVAEIGLADFGRPEGFMTRQVRRWSKQLAASETRPLPGAEELRARLAEAVPEAQRATVVHGDYRIDNMIVDPEQPRAPIRAVLDWEMATLGDPLADLGMLVVYWDGVGGIAPRLDGRPEFPSKKDMVDRYTERTGLSTQDLEWYVAFAHYKFTAIVEGIHCRYVQGDTVGEGFEHIGDLVPPLIESGLAVFDKGAT